jgi:signal transduction histidine kinase
VPTPGWRENIAPVVGVPDGDEELRLALARNQLDAVQRIAGVGTWDVDLRTGETRWSSHVHRILGHPEPAPPDYQVLLDRVHPDDRARVMQVHADLLDGLREYSLDYRVVWDDGSVRHVHEQGGSDLEDGEVVSVLGTMCDITDQMLVTRNLVDTESRRRELLHRLVRVSEHERDQLAGDLHDGPIQMLTVVAMRLEHLGMVEPDPPPWLDEAVRTVRDTVVQLRDVLVELHPRAGSGDGLDATLAQLAITVVPDLDVEVSVQGDTTDAEARAVFGIVQEVLWDIREWEQARHLDICIDAHAAEIDLTLVGGTAEAGFLGGLLSRAGLLGVRERTEGLGGRCTLDQHDGDPLVRCLLPRVGSGT